MATPTDVFAIPKATAQRAMAAYAERSVGQRALGMPLRLASGDRLFQPNVDRIEQPAHGPPYGLVDSIVIEQGPNYALAKRLQQWRALLARDAGHRTSINVAPSTPPAWGVKTPRAARRLDPRCSFLRNTAVTVDFGPRRTARGPRCRWLRCWAGSAASSAW